MKKRVGEYGLRGREIRGAVEFVGDVPEVLPHGYTPILNAQGRTIGYIDNRADWVLGRPEAKA